MSLQLLANFLGLSSLLFWRLLEPKVPVHLLAGASSNENKGDSVSTAPSVTSPALLVYAAVATGFSLVITAWTFFRISGGLFNPVISFGMALIGVITWARCALLIARQTIATVAASYIVYGVFNGGLNTATTLGNGTSPA
ncbi:uncharacterized protein RAG0_13584 [Rhynchosporium agropyri]|uniref:Uncharacterized protein n=1 Tax=Rhynchosporium agropyri TaxID=914238 RepID=A0A1E1LDE1_9HELO|nr:uncharacterized protein RAG0_13584 [Rhynchosporium agropyri]